ncbi:hypothetical protein KBD11_00525, partial [Candidatus Saccharibacteria bacterium]|nr:hypothetical protein [Candidatus Saccharibacteria bacterium]
MLKRFGSKGFGHHFLFPVIAVFAVGAIGYYMVNASGAAPDRPRYKRAMVDDGPYASRASVDPTSKIRDYLSGGTSNKYAFAITNGQMYHTVLNVGVNELVTVADDGTTKYIPGSLEMRIANAVEWNKANPTKRLNVHIRFHVGGRAPDKWKELCGTVRMEDPQFGGAVDTPRWWVKDAAGYTYRRLYSNAMKALAPAVTAINSNESTKYIIGTVNAPGAAPNYPEPMILYASSSAVRSALASGGFTAAEHNSFMKWFPKASAA